MAGYSSTPLTQKLGIKPGMTVALYAPPPGFAALLDPLPADVVLSEGEPDELVGVALLFVTAAAELTASFGPAAARLVAAGGLWVCWPKRASGVATGLSEGAVREIGLAAGLADNKVCAIDETWSGLRFVYRLADRPARRAHESPAPIDGRAPRS